jgi:hypothetical protein
MRLLFGTAKSIENESLGTARTKIAAFHVWRSSGMAGHKQRIPVFIFAFFLFFLSQDALRAQNNDNGETLPCTAKVLIKVTDQDGNPIKEARVYVISEEEDQDFVKSRKTNAMGIVEFSDVPCGRIKAHIAATGWKSYGDKYNCEKKKLEIHVKLEKDIVS